MSWEGEDKTGWVSPYIIHIIYYIEVYLLRFRCTLYNIIKLYMYPYLHQNRNWWYERFYDVEIEVVKIMGGQFIGGMRNFQHFAGLEL